MCHDLAKSIVGKRFAPSIRILDRLDLMSVWIPVINRRKAVFVRLCVHIVRKGGIGKLNQDRGVVRINDRIDSAQARFVLVSSLVAFHIVTVSSHPVLLFQP